MSDSWLRIRLSLLLGLWQGVALYALFFLERRIPVLANLPLLISLFVGLVFGPVTLQLFPWDFWHRRSFAVMAGGLGFLMVLGAYQGWVLGALPLGDFGVPRLFLFGLTLTVAWLLLVSLVQAWRFGEAQWPRSFMRHLLANSLTLVSAGIALGILWAILGLWAQLFTVVGVDVFAQLFARQGFIWPVCATTFGGVIHGMRSQDDLFERLKAVPGQLATWLLPLSAFLSTLFLMALPFTGLQPIWNTGHASVLMLLLQGAVLALVALALAEPERELAYPGWLVRALSGALVVLPIYSILCAWSLGLRVQQYGWSTDRVWASLLVFMAGTWALAYAGGVARRRLEWAGPLPAINVTLAGGAVAIMLLVNTPVLDPERISVASQVARLVSGKVAPSAFDFDYLRRESGRYGREALESLAKGQVGPLASSIRAMAQAAEDNRLGAFVAHITAQERTRVLPTGKVLDEAFVRYIGQRLDTDPQLQEAYRPGGGVTFLAIDLNADSRDEYVLLSRPPFPLFHRTEQGWAYAGQLASRGSWVTDSELKAALEKAPARTVPEPWRRLEVGSYSLEVQSSDAF